MAAQYVCAAAIAACLAFGSTARADALSTGLSGAGTGTGDAAAQARATRLWGDAVVGSIDATRQRLARLLMTSRVRRDDAQIACAGDGLSRADTALRRARADFAAMGASLDRGDGVSARVALMRLSADRETSRLAATDVDACFAIDHGMDDRTVVSVVVDPSIAPGR